MLTEPIAVTLQVVDVFESLGIPYFIGGSLASAIHGVVRATMDVDLVADMRLEHVAPLVNALGKSFYVDEEMIRAAITHHSSFNIVHLETMFKIDVFLRKGHPFEQAQFERRAKQALTTEPERSVYIASAEDIILAKLEWYRMGGEVSDRQWNDVLNVLKVQKERLDRSYLERWATQLGVADLLQRSWEEAEKVTG